MSNLYKLSHKNAFIFSFTGGEDFEHGPYIVTFPINKTSMVYNISIEPDHILEINEMFQIMINSTLLPLEVFSEVSNDFTIVIVDDDRKLKGETNYVKI